MRTIGVALAAVLSFGLTMFAAQPARAQVALGDIVETALNGQLVIAEVVRVRGNSADLNVGQNNLSQFLDIENMKVLQKAGSGAKATCVAGETVQVPGLANTLLTGKLLKTNGDYCEFDSSGSGFTGWAKCAEIRRQASGANCAPAAATAGRATAAATSAPPRPGLVSCAGKFEGRYATTAGLGGLTIVFRSGKATLSGALSDDETYECWTGGGKIILHKPGEDDLPIEINDDGTLDTPLGELKKKAS
jgi:hypothetical protein